MNPASRTSSAETLDRAAAVLLLALGILGSGAAAAWLGQDGGWDLRNYHWYVPYALLHGRLGFDVLPAFMGPSFHNPLVDLPFYLAVTAFGPLAGSVGLGLVQGLNALPLYAIGRRVLPALPRSGAALLALGGISAAMNIGLIGATAGDNILSLFVLGSIAALLGGSPLAAGLLAGAGFGLKPVLAPFVVGLTLTVAAGAFRRGGLRHFLGFAAAGIGGTALTGGFWMALLAADFGNPLMPYYNDIFASPYVPPLRFADPGFTQGVPWPRVQLPFLAGLVDHISSEAVFTDLRLPLAYGGALVLLGLRLLGRLPRGPAATLALVTVATLVPWSLLFAIYRYALGFALLGPLLAAAALAHLVAARRAALGAGVLMLAVLLVTTRMPETERVPFGPDLAGVEAPPIAEPERAVVLMAGLTPSAFLIPSFPEGVRFLRFDGFWIDPAEQKAGYAAEIRRALAEAGPARLILFDPTERERVASALATFSPGLSIGACRPVRHRFEPAGTNWGRFALCDLEG
ncbi:hypothetical protein [Zavarzinia sp.]|uniref:hypothetical protein n=1 Tax=Zavarzinia sp. TaxID=2027920 RepID=UPI003562E2CD